MFRFNIIYIIVFVFLIELTYAQFSHQFKNTARNIHYGEAEGVAVGSDGTVFLTNVEGGLYAYSYDGSSFTNTAHIYSGGYAQGVAVGIDGTVFLANGSDGLREYSYNGISFTNTEHIGYDPAHGVSVGPDGTIFIANGAHGLQAYRYNGTYMILIHITQIDNGGTARGVAVGTDGTVFLANEDDGLRAYSFNETSFNNTAHIDDYGSARGVAASTDGPVFLANLSKGMFAYTYSPISGTFNSFNSVPEKYSLSQNYPNPFNPLTTMVYPLEKSVRVRLSVYNILGKKITTLVDAYQTPNTYKVQFNGSDLASGIYYYKLYINDKVLETKKMVLIR